MLNLDLRIHLLIIPAVLLWACNDVLDNNNLRSDSDFQDEEFSPPANTTGSFLSSCNMEGSGSVACNVNSPSGKKIIFQDYSLSPRYDLWVTTDVTTATPESLTSDNKKKYTGDVTSDSLEATFIFSFADLSGFLNDVFIGGERFDEDEIFQKKIGNILTFTTEDYAPKTLKQYLVINRCLMGVFLDSWKSGRPGAVETNVKFEDLNSIPYVGDSKRALAVEVVDNNYLPQWEVAIDEISGIYRDDPKDLDEGEVWDCEEQYEAYLNDEPNTLFKSLEDELAILVYDYIVNVQKKTVE
jgi:hypothetical protein